MAQVKRRNKYEVRRALYGWVAWLPLLAPFVFMAMDTSVSLKARRADYDFGRLAAQRRQIAEELDQARSAEAQLSDVSKISEIIARLNMLLPDPRQIQVVMANPDTPMPLMQERPRDEAVETAGEAAVSAGKAPMPVIPSAPAVALPVMVSAPPAASATALVPANFPTAVSTPAVSASRSGSPAAPKPPVLDLPKEQITDLDSPDASSKDMLASL